jgi:ubiquitin carboxyl-terminal hydrolase 4/11
LLHYPSIPLFFFTAGVYNDELNPDNPLGMKGAIARSFGAQMDQLWEPRSASSHNPRDFKMQIQRFAPQFSGYQQHDSQELVAFLLDGLHEDLNRVKKKPYVEKPDWEGGGERELVELARKSWEGYMLRNDSVIVDLFQGQYQSTLTCPVCDKVRGVLFFVLQRRFPDCFFMVGVNHVRSLYVFDAAFAYSQIMETQGLLCSLGSQQTAPRSCCGVER